MPIFPQRESSLPSQRDNSSLSLTIFPRSDNGKLKLEVRVNGLRLYRQLPIKPSQVRDVKERLKTFLLENLSLITSKDALNDLISEFLLTLTGKSLPERPKGKAPEERLKEVKGDYLGSLSWVLVLYLQHFQFKHAKKTLEIHLSAFKWVNQLLGSIPIQELKTAHLLQYQTQRKAQGASNRTVNMEIGLIRKALNWAIDFGLIETHNIKKFPMLPEGKRLHAYLTEDELNRLIEVLKVQNPLLAYRVIFNALTGLRPKEIATLEWSDLDLENRLLFIRKKPENHIKDREERAIPLCETALHILEEVRKLNPHGRYVFSRGHKPVFSTKRQLERASKRAGLEKKVFPYMLRHTFAVFSLKAGMNVYDLKELLGHSDLDTTARYLHTCRTFLFDAVKKLDNLVTLYH